jgi:RNA-directed DNA polymerase
MNSRRWIARNLAVAMLADDWTPRSLQRSLELILGPATRETQVKFVRSLTRKSPGRVPPSCSWLVVFVQKSGWFEKLIAGILRNPTPMGALLTPPKFAPSPRFAELDVPRITTLGDLALWLRLPVEQLDWFVDDMRQHGKTAIPILQHYSYAFVAKASGPPRLIEAPKPRLKTMQRRILHGILDKLPAHDAAHGFVAGRSCLTSAAVHASEAVLITVDLKDFFTTTRLSRVHAMFRALGYPWSVARALTAICSTMTPEVVFQRLPRERRHDWRTRRRFAAAHLPQGAPTSPTLANLAAWQLDARLAGFARSNGATYARYADDLAFSGDAAFADKADWFVRVLGNIAADEGYALNPAKTRIMRANGCQRITGLVVNEHINVGRADFDQLKATLHNCAKLGPKGQNLGGHRNFRAHLDGRVGWVESVNPARGAKLRKIYAAIRW